MCLAGGIQTNDKAISETDAFVGTPHASTLKAENGISMPGDPSIGSWAGGIVLNQ